MGSSGRFFRLAHPLDDGLKRAVVFEPFLRCVHTEVGRKKDEENTLDNQDPHRSRDPFEDRRELFVIHEIEIRGLN